MEHIPVIREHDGFPVLDFKFQNRGDAKALLTGISVEVTAARVDPTPVLEYSLECLDGGLVMAVFNYGWGDAVDVSGTVDLSPLGDAVPRKRLEFSGVTIAPAAAGPVVARSKEDRRYRPTVFGLVRHTDLDPAALPPGLVWSGGNDESHFGRPDGGMPELPVALRYRCADGGEYTDRAQVRRIQRGAYDWREIFVVDGRFEYVPYNLGLMYALQPPSCQYHLLLDPDEGPRAYHRSVAHVVEPRDFERIWLVMASTKSAHYELECRFHAGDGSDISSGPIRLHVWSPQNGYLQSGLGRELPMTQPPPAALRDYDVARHRGIRTRTWGY